MARQGIMLCYPFDIKRFHKWGDIAFMQPKLNGDRCRCVINEEGGVQLLSSEGNMIISVPHIEEAIRSLGLKNLELDGELYVHGMPHQEIHSIVSREVNIHSDYKLMEYHIFDLINEDPQYERFKELITLPQVGQLKFVETHLVSDPKHVDDFYEHVLEEGYEGFIMRDTEALYQRKRLTTIMKCKPREIDSYRIIGYEEEKDKYGVPKGTLGALILEKDGQTFNVGSGFTRDARVAFWAMKETLVGKWCTIKYQEFSSIRNVPIFPVFKQIITKEEVI